MKVLVLGGCGIQGCTALHDLASDDQVAEVICADAQFDALSKIQPFTPMEKITRTAIDAKNPADLVNVIKQADVVIDLLPKEFADPVNEAALAARVSLVNTNYMYDPGDMQDKANAAGIAIMPECGLDPGIDLVLYGSALRRFDTLTGIKSYCGGFPEKSACTNPLNYKTSWIWRGVLSSTKRDSTFIVDGQRVDIPGARQHDEANIHSVEFPGLGILEAIPNGNAAFFTDRMGLSDTIVTTGRYSLRWPGWAAIWRPLKDLGFLDETPVPGLGNGTISPMDFMDKFLAPRLVYQDNEKDLVAMLNIFEGTISGKKMRLTSTLFIERDLDTGLMAMSKGVAYSAVIAAKMIAREKLTQVGLTDKAGAYPAQLSGGQQQRVAIARGLAMTPKIMLFDEPTSALDPEMIGEVLDVMVNLVSEGMTMCVVTHEMGFARKVADRVLFMDMGKIVETGKPDEFFDNPQTHRAADFISKILTH